MVVTAARMDDRTGRRPGVTRRHRARRVVAGLLGAVLLLGTGSVAYADDLSDLTNRLAHARETAQETKGNLADIDELLEGSDAELAKAYAKLKRTQAQIPVAQAEVDKADAEYQVAQREADAVSDRLTTAKSEAQTLQTTIAENEKKSTAARNGVAEMARQFAKGDYGLTGVELIVGAQSLDDVITEYNLSQTAIRTESGTLLELREANAIATSTQVRLQAVEVTINDLKTKADQLVTSAAAAKQTAQAARATLTALEGDQKAAAAKVEERRTAELAQQAQLKQQNVSLRSDIQKLIGLTKKERERLAQEQAAREKAAREKAERDAKNGSSGNGGSSSNGSGGNDSGGNDSGGATSKGFFSYPVKTVYITSSYGMRFHPVLHVWRLHSGTDFRAYCGTPIYAAAAGTVVWAKPYYGFGNEVLLNHGHVDGTNLMSSYNHLSRFSVSTGEHVKRGQLVGYAGATGTVTACHLHFEVFKNGVTVNPMTMF